MAMTAFFVVMPAAYVRGKEPLDWSAELTRGRRERILGPALLAWVPLGLVAYARGYLQLKLSFTLGETRYPLPGESTFAFAVASGLVTAAGAALALAVYYGLLHDRELARRPAPPA
jgi:hypothetical protein